MKRLIFLFFFGLCVAHNSTAQVKIGDNPQNIDASSVLELESTDKVLVITRVTTVQMNSISPLQGALVYNIDLQGVHYYDGTQWVNIGGGGGTSGPLTAEAIVNAGGDPTIVITPTATGDNLEVAPNSISTAQIAPFGINGTTDIQPESIGVGKLAEDVITEFELSENSVGPEQIQNQNIDLGDFNNVAGFITAADVVSADAGNVIESRADGVFYDDTTLQTAIDQNTDAILLDTDQSPDNEIQDITLNNTTNILSLSGTTATVDLSAYAGAAGNPNDELTDINFNTTTNILTLSNSATAAGGTVNLSSLAGGGADGSETKIDPSASVLVAGMGTTLDPYVLTAVGGGGGGTTEVVDGTLLIGTGAAASPFTINPGGPDQILRTNTAGDALAWVDFPAGSGDDNQTAAEVPFAPTTNTTSTDVQTAIEELQTDIDGFSSTSGQSNTASNQGVAGIGLVLPKNVLDLPFKSINTGATGIISVTDDPTNFEVDLDITDNSITLDKIAQNGATDNGDIMQWNTDLDGAGPLTDAGWEVAANTASTTLNDGNIFVGDALNAPQGVVLSGDATIDNLGELTVAPEAIELTMLNQNGATDDGDIIQWNTDLDGPGPLNDAGWEIATNAGHTGDPKSIFFGDVDGVPTQFNHPGTDRPSLYWDYEGRTLSGISYGALAIGVDGEAQGGVLPELSNEVKVHIAEKLSNRVSYSLMLQNSWDEVGATSGSGVGMLFASDRYNDGKGALVFERRDNWGVGDFHFLQNNIGARQAPDLATDKAFTITREKDIRLYGGIDIDGVGAGTGFGTAGQVLSTTGAGVEWVNNGGLPTATADGQIITWDADAIDPTTGAYVVTAPQAIALDAANDQIDITQTIGTATNVISSVSLDAATLEVFDNGTAADATDDVLRIKPATGTLPLTEDQILVTDKATGAIGWEDLPTGITNTNLATDNLTQDAEPRTYDLNNNQLVFEGSGKIGIGDFGFGTNPAAPDQKLHILGEVRSQGFNSSFGSQGAPAFSFASANTTTNDSDTGIWRDQADELVFSAGGEEGLRLEEDGGDVAAILSASLELQEELIDLNNSAGNNGQVLSSATVSGQKGVVWVNQGAGPAAKGRVVNSAASTPTSGLHSVTFPTALSTDQYIINLTAEAVSEPIFINVVSQSTTGFTVKITEFNGTILTNLQIATWHYIIYNP